MSTIITINRTPIIGKVIPKAKEVLLLFSFPSLDGLEEPVSGGSDVSEVSEESSSFSCRNSLGS